MDLDSLKPPKGAVKNKKRIGRGEGSWGKTAGKGTKGGVCSLIFSLSSSVKRLQLFLIFLLFFFDVDTLLSILMGSV